MVYRRKRHCFLWEGWRWLSGLLAKGRWCPKSQRGVFPLNCWMSRKLRLGWQRETCREYIVDSLWVETLIGGVWADTCQSCDIGWTSHLTFLMFSFIISRWVNTCLLCLPLEVVTMHKWKNLYEVLVKRIPSSVSVHSLATFMQRVKHIKMWVLQVWSFVSIVPFIYQGCLTLGNRIYSRKF